MTIMKKYNMYAALMLAVFVLSACEVTKARRDDAQLVSQPDTVSLMLADAADRASRALETLASVEQARTPVSGISSVPNAPMELRRPVTIDWVGPVENIARTLAERASYSFMAIGDQPPAPVIVTVRARKKPIIDVLRDIGLQITNRGKILVDGRQKVVEVQYAPTIQSQNSNLPDEDPPEAGQ